MKMKMKMKKILLVITLLAGVGLSAKDLEKSKKVCLGGNAKMCTAIGIAYQEGLKGVDINLHTAQQYLTKACDMGDGFGCYALGLIHLKGNGVKKDILKGLNILTQACDNGYTKGCKDFNNITKFYKEDYIKACDEGNIDACYSLAILFQKTIPPNDSLSLKLFQKSCNANIILGCYNAGLMFYKKNNMIKAESYLSKACDEGSIEGCGSLGDVYANKKYSKHDDFKAVKLFDKACTGGNLLSCNNLGLMVVQGKGTFKDYAKAKKLFEKSCDKNIGAGCHNLGLIYQHGLGVLKDNDKAKELSKKACTMGYQPACFSLHPSP